MKQLINKPSTLSILLTVSIIFTINLISTFYSHSTTTKALPSTSLLIRLHQVSIKKRSIQTYPTSNLASTSNQVPVPLPLPAPVPLTDHEQPPGSIPYLKLYSALSKTLKPLGLLLLIFWLLFLFAFVGIVASDFFCPNLSTISSSLGLPESVAGVTFLGFGNGAPDVFSTFAAMKSGKGSLAIGELIGAASFIVSVVAGSMVLVCPFKVPRHSFLRDVGFFTFAIALMLYIIHDGRIVRWEATALILLYISYVFVVGFGTWWIERRHRRRELIRKVRNEYADDGEEIEPYHDDPDFPIQPGGQLTESVQLSSTTPVGSPGPYGSPRLLPIPADSPLLTFSTHLNDNQDSISSHSVDFLTESSPNLNLPNLHNRRMRAPSLSYKAQQPSVSFLSPVFTLSRPSNEHRTSDVEYSQTHVRRRSKPINNSPAIRSSILGAIEFRDVVNSLNRDSRAQSLAQFASRPRLSASSGPTRPAVSDPSLEFKRKRSGSHSCAFPMPPNSSPSLAASQSSVSPLSSSTLLKSDEDPRPNPSYGRRMGHRSSQSAAAGTSLVKWGSDWAQSLPSQVSDDLAPRTGFPWLGSDDTDSQSQHRRSVVQIDDVAQRTRNRESRIIAQTPRLEELIEEGGPLEERGSSSGIIPSIMIIGERGDALDISDQDVSPLIKTEVRYWWLILKVICPSIQDWKSKSHAGRLAAIISAPGILLLTLTIPVVQDNSEVYDQADDGEGDPEGQQSMVISSKMDKVEESGAGIPSDERIAHWLSIIQCNLSPILVIVTLLSEEKWYYWCASAMIGISLSIYISQRLDQTVKVVLCFVGFAISMVWILTIVNEVIGVLETIGQILGLSDAVIGLTIFAVGNSLGDLVANITVARMGFPVMAISACFGGPMLNVLLGVGLSSTYLILTHDGTPYEFEESSRLLISGIGLLIVLVITLIVVPLKNYKLTKTWGIFLIGSYVFGMLIHLFFQLIRN
ncbi:Sodium/calcium exchanger protein-domain-containing protein [Melampsora americana]|nr:Sodium/calcium exchanger protein-domain-containing protein [Melampsora americana]